GRLGMVAGVGEAACEILCYESDGLPDDYRGDLLVCSWGDHRVERYRPSPQGATFKAKRMPFVSGGLDFRPVGIDIGPDGSLYFSDWIMGTYAAHHQGRVWRIRWPQAKPQRPADIDDAILAVDRTRREGAARKLANNEEGRTRLRELITTSTDAAVRAAAVSALAAAKEHDTALERIATADPSAGVRLVAMRALNERGRGSPRLAGREQ